MLGLIIDSPWLALLPAGLLVAGALVLRSRTAWISGALWAIYCAYEFGMKTRLLCSGECNIRVDLLVIYPLLALATLVAAVQLFVHWRAMRNGRSTAAAQLR
jgi:hypothetical protein